MPTERPEERSLQDVVDDLGLYPVEAFSFVQQGLSYTVAKLLGEDMDGSQGRHISGPQLCEGLREYAHEQWGLLARIVLHRWGITSTLDFGKIVFALVEAGALQKTDDDTLEDFRNVFDFKRSFDSTYRIGATPVAVVSGEPA